MKEKDDKIMDRFAKAIVQLQSDMHEVKQNMETLATKKDIDRVLTAVDRVLSKGETYDQKAMSHGSILIDHETALRDHNRRIISLESRP